MLKKVEKYVRQHDEFFAVVSPQLYAYGQSPQHYTQVAIAAATYYAAGSIISGAGITAPIAKAGVHAAAGAVSGGVSSSINHTDVGQGMLAGAIAGGISSYAGGYIPKGFGYQLAGRALIGGVTGGISAEIYGGRFGDGFVRGSITGAAEFLFNEMLHKYVIIGTRPGPDGQSVPIVRDSTTGEISNGFPQTYVDPLSSFAQKYLVPIYSEAVSVASGLAVTLNTGNPRLGAITYDTFSNLFNMTRGEPASLPFLPGGIEVVNPPSADGR